MAHTSYIRQHGTSYYLANLLFPRRLRQEVSTLYAIVRVVDDIVDDPTVDDDRAAAQITTYQQWYLFPEVYSDALHYQILADARTLRDRYERPEEWMKAFFWAMIADTQHKHYQTYTDLQDYMRWSAEVIGLMMCELIGYDQTQQDEVYRTAKLLGEAMQYTNFLRDIREDYLDYGRIYMPHDRLARYELTHDDIIHFCHWKPIDDRWRRFVQEEIRHSRELYADAESGIDLLDSQGRKAVYVASRLYAGILDRIESIGYDMFSRDAHTGPWTKTKLLVQSLRSYHVSN